MTQLGATHAKLCTHSLSLFKARFVYVKSNSFRRTVSLEMTHVSSCDIIILTDGRRICIEITGRDFVDCRPETHTRLKKKKKRKEEKESFNLKKANQSAVLFVQNYHVRTRMPSLTQNDETLHRTCALFRPDVRFVVIVINTVIATHVQSTD